MHTIMKSRTGLLEDLNLAGVRLVFHNHPLQVLRFSVKAYSTVTLCRSYFLYVSRV